MAQEGKTAAERRDTSAKTSTEASAKAPIYRAPWWLRGAHAQTIYPVLRSPPAPGYRRERIATPDDDFVDLDWLDAGNPVPATMAAPEDTPGETSPLTILFHGLEGSSHSHYAAALSAALAARGRDGVIVHFRGCSGELNRQPRAYHSGDSDEIDWILRHFRERFRHRRIHAVGVSLGGNALLKWLGERERDAGRVVDAAAAVCAPVDLSVCGHALGRGFNRIYEWNFLRTLKKTAWARLQRFPGLFDGERLRRVHTIYEFDDAVTAPMFGFKDAADYWRRASAKPWLQRIAVPTLMLNSRNDPFLPASALPGAAQVAACVRLDYPREGGHVGFVDGRFPGHIGWLPERLLHFFQCET